MTTILFSNARSESIGEIDDIRAGAWVHVVAPDETELAEIAVKYKLDEDLLRDAVDPYESPRVERDNDTVYVFSRYFHSDDEVINATEPLLIVYKPDFLMTVLRIDSPILNSLTDGRERVITTQKTKTLLQILEAVNRSYHAYVNRATRHILSVRSQLRRTDIDNEVLLGFVDIEDDLNEFLSALLPQAAMLRNLLGGKYLRLYEEDKDLIEDLSLGTGELIELVKSRLKTIVNIRQAYDAIATSELNRTFRRLTSISIFLMIPTVFSGLYGMNVKLPFAESAHAFSLLIGIIFLSALIAILIFRRKRWI